MIDFKHITYQADGGIAQIHLNRPEVLNAFHQEMITEIEEAIKMLSEDSKVRVMVLKGNGNAFCSGADLNWMKNVVNFSYEQNLEESRLLASCLDTIYHCPKPTLAVVHGTAMGGGNGLFAACDIVIAEEATVFSLSEVKIGLIPACIAPYVLKRTGEHRGKELMLTGKKIPAKLAMSYGLINQCVSHKLLASVQEEYLQMLLNAEPHAVVHCKELINQVVNHLSLSKAKEYTAKMIAEIRKSRSGQEGMQAFLEKRKPNWVKPE